MLNLFMARECMNKEKFIYENIKGKTYVLVPNQYTLVAEEQALKYTGSACLLDIEILSLNRLGQRIRRSTVRRISKFLTSMVAYASVQDYKVA